MVKQAKNAIKSEGKKAAKAATLTKKAVSKTAKPFKKGTAARTGKIAAARTPTSPIFISDPNGAEERCDWDPARNIYVCTFLNEGETIPANSIFVQRACFKSTVQPVAAGSPLSPIYVSGPNGELERCDWNAQKNIYVCKLVSEGETAPANAVLFQRATV